jgi:hypothetical protein
VLLGALGVLLGAPGELLVCSWVLLGSSWVFVRLLVVLVLLGCSWVLLVVITSRTEGTMTPPKQSMLSALTESEHALVLS